MKKVLVLILAYNAERHIVNVLNRLPESLWHHPEYTTEVVVIDDCSKDNTSRVAREHFDNCPYPICLLRNAINQGYGGNQKIAYTHAIEQGVDVAVMLHGDGQYPPEMIPDIVEPLIRGEADAVFGSRMMQKDSALKGGMPYYKFIGNIVLTRVQNFVMGSHLTEFHSGFRAYSVEALKRIPFQYNSDVFDFDTDIIIQLIDNKMTIGEIAIPTHYGDEVCHVNGTKYAIDILCSTFFSRVQKFGILYTPKFDYEQGLSYPSKTAFDSSHTYAITQVSPGASVLDIGGGEGYVASELRKVGCRVVGCDWRATEAMGSGYDNAVAMDLNHPDFAALSGTERFDTVLLLDVIEHLLSPEKFLDALYGWCVEDSPQIVITTPNIAFFIPRFMLLFGQFNYGKRGTLDMTHTRLFTFSSLRRVLANAGFNVISVKGIPAPFPLAFGDNWLGRSLLALNNVLIILSRSLFAYQIAVVARPRPTLQTLVKKAIAHGEAVK